MKNSLIKNAIAPLTLCSLVVLSGCATSPEKNAQVTQYENQYQRMAADSSMQKYASVELSNAEDSLDQAKQMAESGASEAALDHQLYLVEKKLDIAKQTARYGEASKRTEDAELKQKNMLLSVREQELQQAEREAKNYKNKAENYRSQAEAASDYASKLEQKTKELNARAEQLSGQVSSLTTKQTERGLVLTLGDILFETAESDLQPGAEKTLGRVAEFLNEYPERKIMVEGFTDDRGSADFNKDLSLDRALSVREELVGEGVSRTRMQVKGYGERFPVASNDTSQGRQLNRRVELLILNDGENRERAEQISSR